MTPDSRGGRRRHDIVRFGGRSSALHTCLNVVELIRQGTEWRREGGQISFLDYRCNVSPLPRALVQERVVFVLSDKGFSMKRD